MIWEGYRILVFRLNLGGSSGLEAFTCMHGARAGDKIMVPGYSVITERSKGTGGFCVGFVVRMAAVGLHRNYVHHY